MLFSALRRVAGFSPCHWSLDIPPKPHQVGPASWPVGNVEPAFQPATPTFLSALSAANPKPSRAALIQRVLSPLFAFSLRLRASALKSFVYDRQTSHPCRRIPAHCSRGGRFSGQIGRASCRE